MTFRIGQKAVCIAPGKSNWAGTNQCVVGSIYTVRQIHIRLGECGILLEEITNPPWSFDGLECGFRASRFRPLVERKTDISVFTALLNPANHNEFVE